MQKEVIHVSQLALQIIELQREIWEANEGFPPFSKALTRNTTETAAKLKETLVSKSAATHAWLSLRSHFPIQLAQCSRDIMLLRYQTNQLYPVVVILNTVKRSRRLKKDQKGSGKSLATLNT